MMQVVEFPQGTPEWLQFRRTKDNASDAPVMADQSSYETRSELIKRLATGVEKEFDARTQALLDEGHRIEPLARSKAEEIIGESLYPVTGYDGDLSASFDGLTMDWSINWEHKTLNKTLREALPLEGLNPVVTLPHQYLIQMQQQMLVSGAERTLFMASKWDGDNCVECRWCWVEFDPKYAADIVAGWAQLKIDVANYKPSEPVVEAVAAPVESLPAVSVRVDGHLTVIDNFELFGEKLRAFIEKIPVKPSTDQEFADTVAACKALKKAEDALDAAEANALAQVSSVEAMQRMKVTLHELARQTRLAKEKLVESRKEQIKVEILQEGKDGIAKHIADINTRLGKPYMPVIATDFPGAIKGLRTVSSVRNAMETELARAKIEASRIGDLIQTNLNTLRDNAKDYTFLFADAGQLVLKDNEAMTAIMNGRIAQHKADQEAKEKAERERVANEEREKIAREEREKIAADERAKRDAELAEERQTTATAAVITPQDCPTPEALFPPPNSAPAQLQYAATTRMSTAPKSIGRKLPKPDLMELISVISDHYNISMAEASDLLADAIKADKGQK